MPEKGTAVVTIVTDWARCRRGVLWTPCLAQLRDLSIDDVREYGLADEVELMSAPRGEELFIERLHKSEVLIINWDAANGDPDFGADFVLRWFQHRGPEIRSWVAGGGVLIIEGQAKLGVPNDAAYDAILDPGEVAVCGPEDALRPKLQRRRYGHICRLTKRAQKSLLFEDMAEPDLDSRPVTRAYLEMLPGVASRILTPDLGDLQWNMLYRGWFRWNPLNRPRLSWVTLVRTADRQWWKGRFNHPVMLGARHGQGAVFASTMFLASSGQTSLVTCLLRAHGRANLMPVRTGISRPVGDFVKRNLVPLLAGLVAAPVVGVVGTWDSTGILSSMTSAVLAVVAFFVVGVVTRLLGGLWRLGKEVVGW